MRLCDAVKKAGANSKEVTNNIKRFIQKVGALNCAPTFFSITQHLHHC
jgi:hypothetical protein